jgi:Bacterial pre-peptidase C-terminal domain/Metallo-peptidase family M12
VKRIVLFGAVIAAGIGVLPRLVEAQSIPKANLLDGRYQGTDALAAAKAKNVLPQAAAKIGQTEAKLTDILTTDPSAGLDQTGQLFYVEPKAQPQVASIPKSAAAPGVSLAPFPYAQTFQLHSKPGSQRVIYLDFDGYTTSANAAWGPIVGTAFDTDGNPATFTNLEQDEIQGTWQRMAEDFAPFDVDVTTQDPGIAAIERTSTADLNYGSVVAFANTTTPQLCNGTCGGVAYVGTYGFVGNLQYQPAWVFPPGVGLQKGMAEAGSHEAGHNFGLNHDACNATAGSCRAGEPYYIGHANWAPIMGVGYYQPVSQWSKGEYLGANNTEDDLAIISANAPIIADEPNVGIPTATDLGALTTPKSGGGLMSAGGDSDFFKFTVAAAGNVRVNAFPVPNSPNLDVNLTILNAAGAVLGSAAPVSGAVSAEEASGMDASVTVAVPAAGVYYAQITSEGTDPAGDTGYSTYGSVGKYSITAEFGLVSDTFFPVSVSRLLDTRDTNAPILTGATRNLTVTGVGGVPANATAVALNVAAVNPLSNGHLRVFPAGSALPNASVVNFTRTKNTPNHVIAKVGVGGQISIYAGNQTHVIVDINGYFVDDGTGSRYTPVASPTRLVSVTIPGATANPADSTITVPVLGQGGNPGSGVPSVAVNVAVLNPTATGHIRVFPADAATIPTASTNNFVAGDSRINLVLVNPSAAGAIKIYNTSTGPLTVTVDTVGYFSATGARFKSVTPIRALDTRDPAGSAPMSAGEFREVQIRGVGSVPVSADVTSVAVNVAAVNPAFAGSIDVSPGGESPLLYNVLHPSAENVANLVMVPVGSNGKIRVVNNAGGSSHVIVDIVGYFTS